MTSVRETAARVARTQEAGRPETVPQEAAAPQWATRRERSSLPVLRLMAWIATRLGRPVARVVLAGIALYFLIFSPGPRQQSKHYLSRVLGRAVRWRDQYRHFHAFASTVLDRVYFARGDVAAFDMHHFGIEALEAMAAEGRGVVLLGAHMGSFEALHALGASRPGLRVAMVMYPDNARMIHSVLAAIAPEAQLDVIPIGRPDSTLLIREWLAAGGIAGMLGDRFLAADPGRTGLVILPFLGEPAPFSDGPLRLAMLLRQRVVFMTALYRGGARYDLRFEPLADFSRPAADAAGRHAQVQGALKAYVARLESSCHEAPYNWFNFHDFWNPDGRH